MYVATIKGCETIARLETRAIDAYHDTHQYRGEDSLADLHEDETPVETDKLKSFHGCLQVSSNPTDKLAMEMTHDLQILQGQYIDKTVDVPVVTQSQGHTIQTVERKTVEVPQVQFHDRVVDVPVAMQRQVPCPSMPREQIQEFIVEKSDVPVPCVMEKITEAVKHIPRERVLNYTVEQIVDVPVSQIQEKVVGVIHLILQERISERIEAKLASRIQEELLEVIQLIRKTRISERIVEAFMDAPRPADSRTTC